MSAAPAGRQRPPPPVLISGLGSGALLIAVVLVDLTAQPLTPIVDLGWWPAVAVVVGLVVSEPLVFHIDGRDEAVSFSPSDIPLAVGLLTLPPIGLLVCRLTGAGIGLLLFRKQPLFKFTLNLSSFAAETMIAVTVFRLVVDPGDRVTPVTWLALAVALLVALVIGAIIIAAAISCFEGDLLGRVGRELRHTYLFHLPGAVVGASAAVPVGIEPWLGAVFLVPVPLVWLVLRSHGSLMHQYSDLSDIHSISNKITRSRQLDEVLSVGARQIANHLRAKATGLVVWDEEGATARAIYGDEHLERLLPTGPEDQLVTMLEGADPMVVAAGPIGPIERRLTAAGFGQAILVPLHDGERRSGLLVAVDRNGADDRFSPEDRQRLQPITDQLAIAIRRSQLDLRTQHEATHDSLTGLANRAYFEAWAKQTLAEGRPGGCTLLLIDLDGFKGVNDTFGHRAGDELLVEVADVLRAHSRDEDLAARLGGDEFTVLTSGGDLGAAVDLAERIATALERPIELYSTTVTIGASIGIARAEQDDRDVSALLHQADLAMYEAKRQRSRVVLYGAELASAQAEQHGSIER